MDNLGEVCCGIGILGAQPETVANPDNGYVFDRVAHCGWTTIATVGEVGAIVGDAVGEVGALVGPHEGDPVSRLRSP